MTEREWLSSSDPAAMLHVMSSGIDKAGTRIGSSRKLRLFACACCRQVWDTLTPTGRDAVVVAEQFADDAADAEALKYAARSGCPACCTDPRTAAQQMVAESSQPTLLAPLLRDVIGNPFRPMGRFPHGVCRIEGQAVGEQVVLYRALAWREGTVPRLAQAICDERAFDRMPILRDALEEAGCRDEDVLMHCRGQEGCPHCEGSGVEEVPAGWKPCRHCRGEGMRQVLHVRGCHILDLLLGKE